ncbi:hypothetical protein J421_1847 [Gemmatirosa kalamazoonensis]|uniref:Uncharacterized protein n=1 Tax=Gemmatirosa kalamazoonensis TaxID=861299 RepID=W0RE61_9BACT|nr:hypothetical protein [Gemmatirosa kalamazoonensis]AHG89384.1 hypothetical protein J421_1847 [Gemmatirosa kalamazoonensis]
MTDTTARRSIGAIATLLLLAGAERVGAQPLDSVTPRARVRVDLLTTERTRLGRTRAQSVVGTLAGMRADTVLLAVRDDVPPLHVPVASLRAAFTSRGRPPRWEAALRGAVVPALMGAAVSAIGSAIRHREGDPSPGRMAATSAAWGAATGALLAAWSPSERWHRLTMPTLPTRP